MQLVAVLLRTIRLECSSCCASEDSEAAGQFGCCAVQGRTEVDSALSAVDLHVQD